MATSDDGLKLRDLPRLISKVLGPTDGVVITQEQIDAFAQLTGDSQWIHTDPGRAATGPYGTTIAHGFLTLALLSQFLGTLIDVSDASAAVNYGVNRVRFPSPMRAGSTLRATAEVLDVRTEQRGVLLIARVIMECNGNSKPVCVAESVTLYPGGQAS